VSAAQAIRKRDSEGRCILVSADHYMPYDRPPLSKNFLADEKVTEDDAASKFDNFYPDNKIELMLKTVVTHIDITNNVATLKDGKKIGYEKLLLATGSTPRTLHLDGHDWEGILTLRTVDDAKRLREAMKTAKRAVIVGAGFLGPEVASQCAAKGIDTTLIMPHSHIWDRFASAALGDFMNRYYESKGVKLLPHLQVGSFDEGAVTTSNKTRLDADFVLLAIGVKQNLELAEKSGIGCTPNGVRVDETLRTTDADVYAAGDITEFPDIAMDRRYHVEHHLNARWQGEVAGANMAGDHMEYDRVPYFFSDFFDLHMILRGQCDSTTNTRLLGSYGSADFIELCADQSGVLRMGVAISRDEKKLDPISDRLEELIRARVKADSLTLDDFKATASA